MHHIDDKTGYGCGVYKRLDESLFTIVGGDAVVVFDSRYLVNQKITASILSNITNGEEELRKVVMDFFCPKAWYVEKWIYGRFCQGSAKRHFDSQNFQSARKESFGLLHAYDLSGGSFNNGMSITPHSDQFLPPPIWRQRAHNR